MKIHYLIILTQGEVSLQIEYKGKTKNITYYQKINEEEESCKNRIREGEG